MVVAEEVDGVVEGVGRVGRVTEEVEVEVTRTRCCSNNTAHSLTGRRFLESLNSIPRTGRAENCFYRN